MNFIFLLVMSFATNIIFSFPKFYNQTFMQTRPCYAHTNAQNQVWNEIAFEKESCKNSHFQFVTFYQKSASTPSSESNKLAQYFLMKGKNYLTVVGDAYSTQQKLDRDVRAEWLELPSTFSGVLTLYPSQKQSGFLVELKKCFFDYQERKNFLHNFWFGTSIYFSNVENNLNLQESIRSTTTSTSKTIISQIGRSDLKFGRFIPGKRTSIGFSEVRLKFGTHFDCSNDLHIALSSFFLLPLVSKPVPTYVFTPMHGYNGHPGWGAAIAFEFPLNNRCSNFTLDFFANVENIFFFKSREDRVLDLLNKPWSRFLLLNKNNGETDIPATQVLTRRVEVHPYNYVDLNTGFKVRHNSFFAEMNYGLWAHPLEKLKLVHEFARNYGIAAPAGSALTPGGIAPTASTSTIKTQEAVDKDSDGNTQFDGIQENELDLESGGAAPTLTSKAEVSIGLIRDGNKCNVAFALGAFAEIPQNNAALKNVGFWGKIAASF